jgi:uncharacterized protein
LCPGVSAKLNLVTEVDIARKRIALCIKQAQEPPARKEKPQQQAARKDFGKPKEKGKTELSMNDALSMLKSKFGK